MAACLLNFQLVSVHIPINILNVWGSCLNISSPLASIMEQNKSKPSFLLGKACLSETKSMIYFITWDFKYSMGKEITNFPNTFAHSLINYNTWNRIITSSLAISAFRITFRVSSINLIWFPFDIILTTSSL